MKAQIAAALVILSSSSAGAAVIYDNGAPNFANFGAQFSEGSFRVADDFSLGSADTIRSIEFWGVHWFTGVVPAVEDFVVTIYGDAGGTPNTGAVLGTSGTSLVSRIDTGFDHNGVSGANILDYSMNLVTPIALGPGTYWLQLHLGTDAPGTQFAWQESGLDGSGNAHQSSDFGATFPLNFGNTTAFNISNTSAVPEPGSLVLLGMGIVGIGVLRLKTRK